MARSENQKMKILYVAKFFMEYSDENHSVSAGDIIDYLQTEYNVTANRQSIYRDIAALRDEFGMDIDGGQGGRYRLVSRNLEYDDLQIIAECVYAAKFIPEDKARQLVTGISSLCSTYQAEDLCNEVFLPDRVKTAQKGILNTIGVIRQAMATRWEGMPHTPCKVSFQYMRHTINSMDKPVPRFWGRRYVVSPYRLLMYDGNYYLLAYTDNLKEMRTYRVDRIHDIRFERGPRTGQAEYDALDMATYVKRTMFMIPGETSQISVLFENKLLDTVIERFGTGAETFYRPEGKKHFVLHTTVDVTEQFFAWLCSFGTQAKILGPADVVEKMRSFIFSVYNSYTIPTDKNE